MNTNDNQSASSPVHRLVGRFLNIENKLSRGAKSNALTNHALQVFLYDFKRHGPNCWTNSQHGLVPYIIIPSRSQEVMSIPSNAEFEVIGAVNIDGSSIIWKRHYRGSYSTCPHGPIKQTGFNEQDQVLTDGIIVRGWKRAGTIALVEQQKVTDQVDITFHNLVLRSVGVFGGIIVTMLFDADDNKQTTTVDECGSADLRICGFAGLSPNAKITGPETDTIPTNQRDTGSGASPCWVAGKS